MSDDSTEQRKDSCEARIGSHMESREGNYRMLFQREAPDVTEDPAFALAYIDHAKSELGYGGGKWAAEAEQDHVINFVRDALRRVDAGELDEIPWEDGAPLLDDDEHDPEDSAYNGLTLEEAMTDILNTIHTDTEDDRIRQMDESVLAVSTTVTIRVELSTGGPADYLTAEIDPEDRSVGSITYHFADWFDHAERQVDSDSPLASLVEYFAEIVTLPGGED